MNRTPSPLTPSYDYSQSLPQPHKQDDVYNPAHQAFFSPPSDQPHSNSQYPPIANAQQFNYPAPQNIAPQPVMYQAQPPPDSDSRSQPASGSKPPKKNQYPCPLAKQYGCNDFFTTSGHAARHAKKHTGKKDAFCPECNKAFTRKDNMEQHRRTHQNGRNANKSGESQSKRVKTSSSSASKRSSKPSPMQGSLPTLDPSLPQSPASSYGYPEPSFATLQYANQPYPQDLLQSPNTQNSPYPNMTGPFDPALAMNGLDALASVASKRDADF